MEPFAVGDAILWGTNSGVVRFLGKTHFQDGDWVGVELEAPLGKNDGSAQGTRYFSCKEKHGLFVRPSTIAKKGATGADSPASAASKASTSARGAAKTPVAVHRMRKAAALPEMSTQGLSEEAASIAAVRGGVSSERAGSSRQDARGARCADASSLPATGGAPRLPPLAGAMTRKACAPSQGQEQKGELSNRTDSSSVAGRPTRRSNESCRVSSKDAGGAHSALVKHRLRPDRHISISDEEWDGDIIADDAANSFTISSNNGEEVSAQVLFQALQVSQRELKEAQHRESQLRQELERLRSSAGGERGVDVEKDLGARSVRMLQDNMLESTSRVQVALLTDLTVYTQPDEASTVVATLACGTEATVADAWEEEGKQEAWLCLQWGESVMSGWARRLNASLLDLHLARDPEKSFTCPWLTGREMKQLEQLQQLTACSPKYPMNLMVKELRGVLEKFAHQLDSVAPVDPKTGLAILHVADQVCRSAISRLIGPVALGGDGKDGNAKVFPLPGHVDVFRLRLHRHLGMSHGDRLSNLRKKDRDAFHELLSPIGQESAFGSREDPKGFQEFLERFSESPVDIQKTRGPDQPAPSPLVLPSDDVHRYDFVATSKARLPVAGKGKAASKRQPKTEAQGQAEVLFSAEERRCGAFLCLRERVGECKMDFSWDPSAPAWEEIQGSIENIEVAAVAAACVRGGRKRRETIAKSFAKRSSEDEIRDRIPFYVRHVEEWVLRLRASAEDLQDACKKADEHQGAAGKHFVAPRRDSPLLPPESMCWGKGKEEGKEEKKDERQEERARRRRLAKRFHAPNGSFVKAWALALQNAARELREACNLTRLPVSLPGCGLTSGIAKSTVAPDKRQLLAEAMEKKSSFWTQEAPKAKKQVPSLEAAETSAPGAFSRQQKEGGINAAITDGGRSRLEKSNAAAATPLYTSPRSASYDASLDMALWKKHARCPNLRHGQRIFAACEDAWLRWELEAAKAEASRAVAVRAAQSGRPSLAEAGDGSSGPPPVHGLRLKDFRRLVEENKRWFEEEIFCPFSRKMRQKTMYEVCPELVIPQTTCMERIVKLSQADVEMLKPQEDGGILVSSIDVTIADGACQARNGSVRLGGQDLQAGLTLHGRLARGGKLRQKYWELGDRRQSMWRTRPEHSREAAELSQVARIPPELLSGTEPLGEKEERIWDLNVLRAGDIVVFRKGVSLMQVCEEGSGGFPLHTFASHFWGEETVQFLATLELHAAHHSSSVKPDDRVYYICTFHNNQHRVELGSSWNDSPFSRALDYVAACARRKPCSYDAVMAFGAEAKPLERKWCIFEAWRCTELELNLKLYSPLGAITRQSAHENDLHRAVVQKLQNIDLKAAGCSVKSDAVIIDRAIEDARGGFMAVQAKLRTCVLSLTTFIGSLADSVDPMTGNKLEEMELSVQIMAPESMRGQRFQAPPLAEALCKGGVQVGKQLGKHFLLVAPAGSGKSTFSRAMVRQALSLFDERKSRMLPIRVPLGSLARTAASLKSEAERAYDEKNQRRSSVRQEPSAVVAGVAAPPTTKQDWHDKLFDHWAEATFLKDSPAVTNKQQERLLILDGFDEAGSSRADIMEWLRRYLQQQENVVVFLTTRPSGIDHVCTSSGVVTRTRQFKVAHFSENLQAVHFQTDLRLGTALQQSLSADKLLYVAREHQQEIVCGTRPLATAEQALLLAPGEYTGVPLIDGVNSGTGAKVNVTIDNNLKKPGFGFQGAESIIRLQVVAGGVGYLHGGTVSITGTLALHTVAALKAAVQAKRKAKARAAQKVEGLQRKLDELGDVREKLKTSGGNEKMHQAQIVQQLLETRAADEHKFSLMQARARKLALQVERLEHLIVLRETQPPQTFLFRIAVEKRHFVQLSNRAPHAKGFCDADLFSLNDLKLSTGDTLHEADVRTQLAQELGFSDMELQPLDAAEACEIVKGASSNLDLQPESLSTLRPELFDRPLMAGLLAQYLKAKGLEGMSALLSPAAETDILQFCAAELLSHAAVVCAPSTRKEDISALHLRLSSSLPLICLDICASGAKGGRVMTKDSFRGRSFPRFGPGQDQRSEELPIWDDARRGHLRLFEPTQEGVQFYHLRLQELLAARAWQRLHPAGSLEDACCELARSENLVQTGVAPLRFIVQEALAEVVAREGTARLTLAFKYLPQCVAQTLRDWLPHSLQELSLSCYGGDEAGMARCFFEVLPQLATLLRLRLLGAKSLISQTITWLRDSSHEGGGAWPLPSQLQKLCIGRPRDCGSDFWCEALDAFELDLPAPNTKEMEPNSSGGMQQARGLRVLHLDMEVMQSSYEEELVPLLATLPRGLQRVWVAPLAGANALRRRSVQCPASWPEGLVDLGINFQGIRMRDDRDGKHKDTLPDKDTPPAPLQLSLPHGLRHLEMWPGVYHSKPASLLRLVEQLPSLQSLSLRHCFRMMEEEVWELVTGLSKVAPDLQELRLELDRCSSRRLDSLVQIEKEVKCLAKEFPKSLRSFTFRAPDCAWLRDGSLREFITPLPHSMRTLNIGCSRCRQLTSALFNSLDFPPGLQELKLDLGACPGLVNSSAALAAVLPQGLQKLDVSLGEIIHGTTLDGLREGADMGATVQSKGALEPPVPGSVCP